MKDRLSFPALVVGSSLGLVVMLASPLGWATTETDRILLNAYDIANIQLSDQDGGGGWYVGRHSTFGRLLDGGSDRPWLPVGNAQDIYWQMLYPTPLNLDELAISITSEGSGESIIGAGSHVEYTTVASPGPGDWTPLVTGIVEGSATYNSFAPVTVQGLRWVLPTTSHSGTGTWAPRLTYLHAYGTNTVETAGPVLYRERFNLLPNHATVTTGGVGAWGSANNPTAVNDENPAPRALWNMGAVPAGGFIQFTLDQTYSLGRLWMDWEGPTQSFRPNSYDLDWSLDGVNWFTFVNDHVVPPDGSQDNVLLGGFATQYLRISDIRGVNNGNVILHEAMLYQVAFPEPSTAALIALGGLLVCRHRWRNG